MYITIDGFESLTAQEVFDMSATHLLKQGKRSLRERTDYAGAPNQCLYRGPDGLQCAAGIFLKDGEVIEASWGSLVQKGLAPNINYGLIVGLQGIHDTSSYEVSEWPTKLKELAIKHELSSKVVDDWAVAETA